MSSRWTHSICDECWPIHGSPELGEPFRLKPNFREQETCCFCGKPNSSGVSIRENPEKLLCRGEHKEKVHD